MGKAMKFNRKAIISSIGRPIFSLILVGILVWFQVFAKWEYWVIKYIAWECQTAYIGSSGFQDGMFQKIHLSSKNSRFVVKSNVLKISLVIFNLLQRENIYLWQILAFHKAGMPRAYFYLLSEFTNWIMNQLTISITARDIKAVWW